MEVLKVLTNPILPVFAIMAGGFFAGRRGWTTLDEARTINRFAMTVLLPIFIFRLIATAPISQFPLVEVLTYAATEAVVFALSFTLARFVFARDLAESVLLAFGCIFVNNALYGLPIAILLYGEDGVMPLTAVVTLDSVITFAAVMVALQWIAHGRAQPRAIAGALLRTPLIWGIAGGLIVGLSQIQLPGPIDTFVAFNGVAAAPVALFALGVVLSQTRFAADPTVAAFCAVKLLVFPGVLWALFTATGQFDDAIWAENKQFLLAGAGPAGAMAFSLALLHNVRADAIAQVVVWTSVLSLISLALLA